MPTGYADSIFFHKATQILALSDVKEALSQLYAFLAESFPIEGMVMHHFLPSPQSLLDLHLVQKDCFHFLGHFVPFSREQAMFLRAFSMVGGINAIPDSTAVKTAAQVDKDVSAYLENRPRAHLVCCLKAGITPLGLVRLLGTEVGCFTEEHERRLLMLAIPLSFALLKLLRLDDVQAFFSENGYLYPPVPQEDTEPSEVMIGTGLRGLMDTVKKLSGTDAPVLILGETGTGKELVANAIQARSQRTGKPFIKVNCGAIPETLMDSTLFGYEKGAFTGAYTSTAGKFEVANGGTLFLDELGELPLQAQVRLLRTLQNRVIERVGSTISIPVDVRIIAATNRDIHSMLREGTFREDLYHRLSVFTLAVPPLRERLQDLLPLAEHFICKATRRLHLPPISGIDPESAEKLLQYPWPGNIRELENLVERAVILDYNSKLKLDRYIQLEPLLTEPVFPSDEVLDIRIEQIVQKYMYTYRENIQKESDDPEFIRSDQIETHKLRPLDDVIRDHIRKALNTAGNKVHGKGGAAELLGLNPDTLRKKMKRMGIVKES